MNKKEQAISRDGFTLAGGFAGVQKRGMNFKLFF